MNWKGHTGSSSNNNSILENVWSMDRRIKSEKHETTLFLLTSGSARSVTKTADDRLDRTSKHGQSKI